MIGYTGIPTDVGSTLWCFNGRWEENGYGSTLTFGNELNAGGSITINRQPSYAERDGTNRQKRRGGL